MIINKTYMEIMRRGRLTNYYTRKQEHAGLMLGLCMFIALIIIVVGIFVH